MIVFHINFSIDTLDATCTIHYYFEAILAPYLMAVRILVVAPLVILVMMVFAEKFLFINMDHWWISAAVCPIFV